MKTKIGVIGTGFIARGVSLLLKFKKDLLLSKVLTRRPLNEVTGFPPGTLTQSIEELIDHSDLVVECTGDPIYGTEVLERVARAAIPIVTMDCELQVTTGSYFAQRCYITEAIGGQSGCLAKLKKEVEDISINPLAYISIKRFLNPCPSEEEMLCRSQKNKISLDQTVSFTDGTRIQIEQALLANGLGVKIVKQGMIGKYVEGYRDIDDYGDLALNLNSPICDYIVSPKSPPGVVILGSSEVLDAVNHYGPFKDLLTSQGRYYAYLRPTHLCHAELYKTIRSVLNKRPPLLNNSPRPEYGVGAVAKRAISKGYFLKKGLGSFDVRGEAVSFDERPDHVPVGLLADAHFLRDVEPGEMVSWDHVELGFSRALQIYRSIPKYTKREQTEQRSLK